MIRFVENKTPDMARVSGLLSLCAAENQWANRGPLYRMLADGFAAHFGIGADRAVVPCANAGVALEAMARLLAMRAGRKLRWIGSAFSFQNLGRGHFADMSFVDCDAEGRLDLSEVEAQDPDSYDGLVVVNPFGLFRDFDAYIAFARRTGKLMLIDNAAGVDHTIPDWPWQAFSLHHTKPYGMGEGGLALTPAEAAEDLYGLLNYGPVPGDPSAWINNGKLSDIACAFLIDRLEKVRDWAPKYLVQAERVMRVASAAGLRPVRPFGDAAPATSWVFLADRPIPIERVLAAEHVFLAKYYKPLAPLPRTLDLYSRLVNVPTHPDLAALSEGDLCSELAGLSGLLRPESGWLEPQAAAAR
jgi:dTDP-4-amino-4,6-dideoxygalactose transaminase